MGMRKKGRGWGLRGGGWDEDRQRNRLVNAHAFSKLPLANYPSVLLREDKKGGKFAFTRESCKSSAALAEMCLH